MAPKDEFFATVTFFNQAAIGFELWSMTDDIVFDNIIIANQQSVVDQWTADT